jgi:hypothetical protein
MIGMIQCRHHGVSITDRPFSIARPMSLATRSASAQPEQGRHEILWSLADQLLQESPEGIAPCQGAIEVHDERHGRRMRHGANALLVRSRPRCSVRSAGASACSGKGRLRARCCDARSSPLRSAIARGSAQVRPRSSSIAPRAM